jgi:HSP20 family molecular chaperone IbpA
MSFDKFGQRENVDEWSRKIGDLMDEMMSRSFVGFRDGGTWQPATNVYESAVAYHVCVELAGVESNEIELDCPDRNHVSISGARTQPRHPTLPREVSIHSMEIDEGAFRRDIELPEPVDTARIDASYAKGYLWITIPRLRSK